MTSSSVPLSATFSCRVAGHDVADWSETGVGQYGYACLDCKLFWIFYAEQWKSSRLDEVFFPHRHRGVPRYRTVVGWIGP